MTHLSHSLEILTELSVLKLEVDTDYLWVVFLMFGTEMHTVAQAELQIIGGFMVGMIVSHLLDAVEQLVKCQLEIQHSSG